MVLAPRWVGCCVPLYREYRCMRTDLGSVASRDHGGAEMACCLRNVDDARNIAVF
jgi:hypothetical protein